MGTLIKLRAARRSPRFEAVPAPPSRDEQGDSDLLPIVALLWFASLARVGYAVWEHEVFGAETTLALLFVMLAPGPFRSSLPIRPRCRNVPAPSTPPFTLTPIAPVVPLANARAARERRRSHLNDESA
jgi:hypothetical protein